MNILIAEDDLISRKLLTNILRELGHEVMIACDGAEAWRMYQTSPTRIVISDWLMPKMDGLGLVDRIRSHPKSEYTYIIMLTANVGQRENYIRAMKTGVDDFLAKPLDRIELTIRLEVAQRILQATSRIESLENVLTICAYTKKINFPDEGWQTIEEFLRNHLGITLSHGVDPNYYEEVLKPQIEQLTAKAAGREAAEPVGAREGR
ncbi:MAG: PleD family two-component system response regulator [Opitutales bacterium]